MSVNKLRVLALMHRHLMPPDTIEEGTDITAAPWRTEYDVVSTLTAMGHEVRPLPCTTTSATSAAPRGVEAAYPFNLLEGFDDVTIFDQNVVSHLELLKLSTPDAIRAGCAGARQIALEEAAGLSPHSRAGVGSIPYRPSDSTAQRLTFPLIVKSLTQEASIGISQASVVESDEKLKERVAFIHDSIGTAAIVEQYIEGRELYVGILDILLDDHSGPMLVRG